MTDQEHNDIPGGAPSMFSHLVMMFATSALQQMGKIANPLTGKVDEPHLDAAQATIDMLDMIEEKTLGNLDDEESRMLKEALASLKLTYVDATREAPPSVQAPEAPQAEGNVEEPSDKEEKKPKYHKKYE